MMTRLMRGKSYSIRLVTPAFTAGANQQEAALRVPSIRGCLRWWYRLALKAEGVDGGAIAQREADLFGSIREGQRVVLRLTDVREGPRIPLEYQRFAFDHQYLWFPLRPQLGQSVRIARPAIPAGTVFRLDVLVPSHLGDAEDRLKRLERVVVHWVLFGGLGLRCRRGAGSLWFESLPGGPALPAGRDALVDLLERSRGSLGQVADLVLAAEAQATWQAALEEAGRHYRGRRVEVRQRLGREALPALGWPIVNFPGDGKLGLPDGPERRVERLASPVWLKVIPDGPRFRWLLVVVKKPFWKAVRSELGTVTAQDVLQDFAQGFEQARPPGTPRGRPRAR
ncbi:MAG: type III-B CRISPR module RAMP protein Cmr1 [Armatimonadota bacterium]|nr:type III-B CRISPR module RAMP protein Cmr1 [Armatimonadota bacterium]MDR7528730.1 type III-B CRISPR module RAMP protein Cmr1 [Armatimonadota bacterium]